VVKRGRANELWLQSRKGKFSEHAKAWRVRDECGRGRFVTFLNANGDRWPDLFLGNSHPRNVRDECDRPHNGLPNEKSKLFLNMQGERFRYAPKFMPVNAGPGERCAEVLDYDSDGDDDLILCRTKFDSALLYRNSHYRGFTRVRTPAITAPVADVTVAHFDGDRDDDLIIATRGEFVLHRNKQGTFAPAQTIGVLPRGQANSVAVGDADKDGDKDVFGVAYAPGGANPDDYLWVNTGDNRTFTRLRAPSAIGTADQVVTLHRRGPTSRSEFLVLNGGFTFGNKYPPGPVQLLRLI
jgi:hypothetical protein